jgi:hypothetical protein
VGPIINLIARMAPRPRHLPSDRGRYRLAHAHGFVAAVSCTPFPPPSSTASCGFKRSSSILSSSSAHTPPLLLLTPCRRQPSRHVTELCPRAPPLRCQNGQASATSSTRRRLEPPPQLLFPSRQTPPTVKLHRLPPHSVDATPTTTRVPTTFLNCKPPTTTIGRHPSPSFPSGRAVPPGKLPLR